MCRSHVAAQSYLRSRHSCLNRRPLQDSLNPRTTDMLPDPSPRIPERHVQNQSVIALPKKASSSQQHAQSGRHATRTWHDCHAATPKRHDQVSTNGRFA
jgi:hypothetical protein